MPVGLSCSFGLRSRLLVWHTSRVLLRCSLGTEATGGHLCDIPLLPSRSKVSLGMELILFYGTLASVSASQGLPLDCLALVTSYAYDCGSHRTVTNGESSQPDTTQCTEER